MTSRIETHTGEVVTEIVAPRTELLWNLDNTGYVVFHLEKVTTLNGELISRTPAGRLEHTFDTLLGRTWEVPDGEGGIIMVPTALLMGTIKAALDTLYNETSAIELLEEEPEAE